MSCVLASMSKLKRLERILVATFHFVTYLIYAMSFTFSFLNGIILSFFSCKNVGLCHFLESSELLNDVFEKSCAHFVCFIFFVR